jgi:hypothetical protein
MRKLIALIALFVTTVVGFPTNLVVNCSELECQIEMNLGSELIHKVNLTRESNSLFTDNLTFQINDQQSIILQTDRPLRFHTGPNEKLWATASIKNNKIYNAIFMTINGYVEFRNYVRVNNRFLQDQQNNTFRDVAYDNPNGSPWLINTSNYSDSITLDEWGQIIPFFPGCYTDDTISHLFSMNVAYDYGLFQASVGTVTNPDIQRSMIMNDLEHMFSVGRLIYHSQLNIDIKIKKVILGTLQDTVPLSRSASLGTCIGALGAFPEMQAWNTAHDPTAQGHTMLVSNCFSGITGVSYVGSMCGLYNAGVATNSWLVFFHELGHAFGALHTFENGVGTTGGIMDYGDGTYEGVAQFNPFNKPQICPYLSYIQTRCPYFTIVPPEANCGNGIMDKTETCECLDHSQQCGKCTMCQVTDSNAQCSSSIFRMRVNNDPDTVIVVPGELSDPSCCLPNNKLAAPKTLCGEGKLNACGEFGHCTPICTKYLEWNNANCGWDASGCMLGCMWNNQCRFDLDFYNDDGSRLLISALPNGTLCKLDKNHLGSCYANVCQSSSVYWSHNSHSPTIPIVTVHPTKRPVKIPTKRPVKIPTVFPTRLLPGN